MNQHHVLDKELKEDIGCVNEYLSSLYHVMESNNALRAYNAFQRIRMFLENHHDK